MLIVMIKAIILIYFINFCKCAIDPNYNGNQVKTSYALYNDDNEIVIFNNDHGTHLNDSLFVNGSTKRWICKCVYKNTINQTGFAYLDIETNSFYSDMDQALAAGIIESYHTGDLIYSQWYNTVKDFSISMNQTVIKKINNFIQINNNWILEQLRDKNDEYWHQLKLIYLQISGIHFGYNQFWSKQYGNLTIVDILWLNIFYDLMDLYEAFGGNHNIGNGHCSVLIKLLPNYEDLYFGHNTWTSYQNMLRINKKYVLRYNRSFNEKNIKIPGIEMTFSSYPGTVSSMDDYYLISSGLAVTETTNEMFNKTLWNTISPKNTVWGTLRAMIANRLANDGKSWSDIIKLYNSGTYNNQWMIVDYKKFKPGRKPSANTLWVAEQAPSLVIANDLTDILINNGYWISFNIPYYESIYNLTDYTSMFNKYGSWYSHKSAPRPEIFKRDQVNVTNMDSFMKLMRSNDFKNEPYSFCDCIPPYSAAGAIAGRNDLNLKNGKYQFKGQSYKPTGAIDAKTTNFSLFTKLQFNAVSGPSKGTDNKLQTFTWSTSNFTDVPHLLQPDVWNFEPTLHKWVLP